MIEKTLSEKRILGTDEVGRGCIAGPVVVVTAFIDNTPEIREKLLSLGVTDSKKLNTKKRQSILQSIGLDIREISPKVVYTMEGMSVCLSSVSEEKIDEINILQATFLGMRESRKPFPDDVLWLIDGNQYPVEKTNKVETVVKGDSKSLAIALASIVAKEYRDNLMIDLSLKHPEYEWQKNKGYGSKKHIEGIKQAGFSPYHRKTFKVNLD